MGTLLKILGGRVRRRKISRILTPFLFFPPPLSLSLSTRLTLRDWTVVDCPHEAKVGSQNDEDEDDKGDSN